MSGKIDKFSSDSDKHNGDVTSLQFFNDKVYSGGADGRIKIWDKDLKLIRDIPAHEYHIYAIAVDSKGQVYSSSCDGTIKVIEQPLTSDDSKKLLECGDELLSLAVDNDLLYCGDDKGVVTKFENGSIKLRYNFVEEVTSVAVMNKFIYTIRDNDLTITECVAGTQDKYVTKATIPGKHPVKLFNNNQLAAILTRSGKGFTIIENNVDKAFPILASKDNVHEMIINSMCGSTDLYTACYGGKIKKWTDVTKSPQLKAEADVGNCINALCSSDADNVIYSGSSDGIVRKIVF